MYLLCGGVLLYSFLRFTVNNVTRCLFKGTSIVGVMMSKKPREAICEYKTGGGKKWTENDTYSIPWHWKKYLSANTHSPDGPSVRVMVNLRQQWTQWFTKDRSRKVKIQLVVAVTCNALASLLNLQNTSLQLPIKIVNTLRTFLHYQSLSKFPSLHKTVMAFRTFWKICHLFWLETLNS